MAPLTPTELQSVPYRTAVAMAARAVRRLIPLVRHCWPDGDVAVLEQVAALGERFVAYGRSPLTDDLRAVVSDLNAACLPNPAYKAIHVFQAAELLLSAVECPDDWSSVESSLLVGPGAAFAHPDFKQDRRGACVAAVRSDFERAKAGEPFGDLWPADVDRTPLPDWWTA